MVARCAMRPADVPVIRRASVGDEDGIARVHVDAWREAYAGIVPAEFLASLTYESRRAMWERVLGPDAAHQVVFVADVPGEGIVGFASGYAPPESSSPCVGQLMTLYVLRLWQGRGLGRTLFAAVVDGLGDLGAEQLTLWVLSDNPSRGFYERMGGRSGKTKTESIGGADIEEVEYVWDRLPSDL
jgi:GNAT superfamily N-acetyltransferase